jgi:hypothetical protein
VHATTRHHPIWVVVTPLGRWPRAEQSGRRLRAVQDCLTDESADLRPPRCGPACAALDHVRLNPAVQLGTIGLCRRPLRTVLSAGASLERKSRSLRWVTVMGYRCRATWTGSWTGASDSPSAASAVSAITRVICAASVHGAGGRASHNPPVVGSSPTRPTSSFSIRSAMAVDRCRWCDSSCRHSRPVT